MNEFSEISFLWLNVLLKNKAKYNEEKKQRELAEKLVEEKEKTLTLESEAVLDKEVKEKKVEWKDVNELLCCGELEIECKFEAEWKILRKRRWN